MSSSIGHSEPTLAVEGRSDALDVPEQPTKAPIPAWANRTLIGAIVVAITVLLFQILVYDYGRDQGIYAMVGKTVLEGGMPYRDAWDFKPPGIFLLYAAARALFGANQIGIRVLEVLGLIAMVALMIRLARQWWNEPRIGWIAGGLAIVAHAQLEFWHTAQPESFGGMLTILGLLIGTRGRPSAWLGAGVLFGVAGLMKPPLAGGGAVLALVLALEIYHRRPVTLSARRALQQAFRPVAFVALGGALPIAACLGWFWARGALGDLYDVLLVFTPHYTKLGWEDASPIGMAYWGFTTWLFHYSSPISVGLLLLLGLRPAPNERHKVMLLAGVIAIQLVGIVMQGKFFPYHYGAIWPVTAMLAGLGANKVFERAARRGLSGVALYFVGFGVVALGRSATKDTPDSFLDRCFARLVLYTTPQRSEDARDALASVADVNAAANREVAKILQEQVPSRAPVYIYGFEPVIYDLSNRRPATRFLYNVPQRVPWAAEPMRARLMADLERSPPAAIVVERHDVFPGVTGTTIDSADTLAEFAALRELIETRYRLFKEIEDFQIYLAKTELPAP
jgi:hypothetical protein